MNNDVVILERKKDSKGFEIREALLKREFSTLDFQGIRDQYLKKDVANDDILDALAVLWSAQRVARREAIFLPANPNKPKMSIAF
jgi:predicted RNase H-like nuclease